MKSGTTTSNPCAVCSRWNARQVCISSEIITATHTATHTATLTATHSIHCHTIKCAFHQRSSLQHTEAHTATHTATRTATHTPSTATQSSAHFIRDHHCNTLKHTLQQTLQHTLQHTPHPLPHNQVRISSEVITATH